MLKTMTRAALSAAEHAAQQLEPACTFKIEIENDDVRLFARVDREAIVDVGGFENLSFEMRDEQPLQAFANNAVIVNDEDFHAALACLVWAWAASGQWNFSNQDNTPFRRLGR